VELESDEDDNEANSETVHVGGVEHMIRPKRRRVTVGDGFESDIKMGETVTAGEYRLQRIEGIVEDGRKENHKPL
jgi:hypothetical protein